MGDHWSRALEAADTSRKHHEPPFSGRLFHYTRALFADNILRSGHVRVRAAHTQGTNAAGATGTEATRDSLDGRYLWRRASTRRHARCPAEAFDPLAPDCGAAWTQHAPDPTRIDSPYVFCMSDRLSRWHWENYADGGSGVAVEVEPATVVDAARCVRTFNNRKVAFGAVISGVEAMDEVLDLIENAAATEARQLVADVGHWARDDRLHAAAERVAGRAWSLLSLFSPFYKEAAEQHCEWRVVIPGPPSDAVLTPPYFERANEKTGDVDRCVAMPLARRHIRQLWLGPSFAAHELSRRWQRAGVNVKAWK